MADKSKTTDYRKKYKRHYGIEFGPDYHIHHIDGERDNNDIGNLLLLPRNLHNSFHIAQGDIRFAVAESIMGFSATYPAINRFLFALELMEKHEETVVEVSRWVLAKFEADNGGGTYGGFQGIEKF